MLMLYAVDTVISHDIDVGWEWAEMVASMGWQTPLRRAIPMKAQGQKKLFSVQNRPVEVETQIMVRTGCRCESNRSRAESSL